MTRLDKSYWNSQPEVVTANTKGFNYLQTIPELIKRAYPEFRGWTFGFCDKEHLPIWLAGAWSFTTKEDFPDIDSFNESISSRFGLIPTADNRLQYRNSYLMKMPTEYRERQNKKAHQQSKATFESFVGAGKEDAQGIETMYEEKEIVTVPDKRKPGRPKKE